MEIYEVGGSVRDRMLGLESKDKDFAVEAESFDAMVDGLTERGFKIFLSTPEYLTVRAKFPNGHKFSSQTADFVLCRAEGEYSDGRHPDYVRPGTIFDDLARRDFTVNAMAVNANGILIDPHNGNKDLANMRLKTVGDASVRFAEDYLRALRAVRFFIVKGFYLDPEVTKALLDPATAEGLKSVSVERIREEMYKAFKHDTLATIKFLNNFREIRDVVFSRGLWLEPTLKEK